MRRASMVATLVFLANSVCGPYEARAQSSQLLDIDGHKMNVWSGGARGQQGQPAIVFEAGMNSPLQAWGTVLDTVSKFARVVAYDRAGNGKSEPDGESPTPDHVARNLRAVLTRVDAGAPYVLVGHSWGGPLIRKFAALYPDEIAGLVYVDPTELRSEPEERAFYKALGYTDGQLETRRERRRQQVRGVGGEMLVAQRLADGYFAEFRNLPPVSGPVAVLMSGKFNPATWAQEPCQPRDCQQKWIELRLASMTRLAAEGTQGTVVFSSATSHDIPKDDPDLIVWAIRRVLDATAQRH